MKATFLLLAFGFGAAFTAGAQTLSLNPVSSAFLSSAHPNSNYGGAGALELSATGSTNGIFDSVMQFNLASAAGLSIQSITLQLTAGSPNNPIFNAQASGSFSVIWMDNSSWIGGSGMPNSPGLTGITYNTLPNYLDASDESLGTFNLNAATSGTNFAVSTLTLQLPSGFVNAVTSGSNVSLELVPSDNNVSYLCYSGSFTTISDRPLLTVTAVPEPASWWLAALGLPLMALACCRRRKA
jgi:hypothetical protein